MIHISNCPSMSRENTHPLERHEGIKSFLRQEHVVGFPAQIREPNPGDSVVVGMKDQGADLEDTLPDLSIRLTTLEPVYNQLHFPQ